MEEIWFFPAEAEVKNYAAEGVERVEPLQPASTKKAPKSLLPPSGRRTTLCTRVLFF